MGECCLAFWGVLGTNPITEKIRRKSKREKGAERKEGNEHQYMQSLLILRFLGIRLLSRVIRASDS